MSNARVESSLSSAARILDQIVSRREKLIKESRDVISLCSKSIVSIHSSDFKEARRLRNEAKKKLAALRKVANVDLIRYLMTPEQEFVESSVMFSLRAREDIPALSELGVLPSSYILGLLDAIGELKRSVYDSIRRGDMQTAEQFFSTMEALFVMISPFAVYDNIVQGLRRKLDVARMLIEDTRATVTEEARRLEFMDSVNKLAAKLGKPKDSIGEVRKPRNPRMLISKEEEAITEHDNEGVTESSER